MDMCEKMRALFLNHKQKDHSKKRQKKRSSELMVLSKFHVEALKRKAESEKMWKEGTVLTPKQVLEQASAPEDNPPPYAPLGRRGEIDPPPWGGEKGLYPVISGTFEVDMKEMGGKPVDADRNVIKEQSMSKK